MAGQTTKKNQMSILKVFDEANNNDLLLGIVQSQKPGNDFIQNCDLPPPVKVFSKPDDRLKLRRVSGNNKNNQEEITDEGTKTGIMKALQLSQTRAREAEAKCALIRKEMSALAVAFVEDSMQIFGYRQLLMLLDFQVSQLQKQQQQQQKTLCHCCDCEGRVRTEADDDDDDNHDDGSATGSDGVIWMMGFAICLGLAGLGFAISCNFH